MATLSHILQHLRPGARPWPSAALARAHGGFVLQDDSDGKGPYIKEWHHNSEPPTAAEIAAVDVKNVSVPRKSIDEKLSRLGVTKAELKAWLNQTD